MSLFLSNLIYFVADILLGFIPQAAGCAICLHAINNLSIGTGKFWATTSIFSAVAVVIRTAYNIKLIDFGFHTIVIWSIFILVAIGFNKLPAIKSIFSILVSGILITATELITAGALILIYGEENFSIMMTNTETLAGKTTKAFCGVPANILFVVVVLIFYFVKRAWKKKKTQASELRNDESSENAEPSEATQEV